MNARNRNTMMNNVRPAVTVQNPPSCTVTERSEPYTEDQYDPAAQWDHANPCEDCGRPTHHGYGTCYPQMVGMDCTKADSPSCGIPVGIEIVNGEEQLVIADPMDIWNSEEPSGADLWSVIRAMEMNSY